MRILPGLLLLIVLVVAACETTNYEYDPSVLTPDTTMGLLEPNLRSSNAYPIGASDFTHRGTNWVTFRWRHSCFLHTYESWGNGAFASTTTIPDSLCNP